MTGDGDITPEDTASMVQGMIALHGEIAKEIAKPQVDPAHLMRLLGAGMNQTLIALAFQLSGGHLLNPEAAETLSDSGQLGLFDVQDSKPE